MIKTYNEETPNFEQLDEIFKTKKEDYLNFLNSCIDSCDNLIEILPEFYFKSDFESISNHRHSIMPTLEILNLSSAINLIKTLNSKSSANDISLNLLIEKLKFISKELKQKRSKI